MAADPLRRRTLTVGASCAIHAAIIGAILLAGHWLRPMLAEKPPILPVEVVTSPDEPKREAAPPPPPPAQRQPPPPSRPLRPIEPPPKIAEAPVAPPPPPEPIRVATEPPPPPPAPAPPPSAPAPAATPTPPTPPPSSPGPALAAAPPSPPNQGGIELRTPSPVASSRPSGNISTSPATATPAVASAPSRSSSTAAGITRTARPQGGYQVRPAYPSTARLAGIQGTAVLRVHVLIDGQVGEVRVQESAGHPDLDEAAVDAVRRWRFEPARRGPDPVAMWVLLPVEFRLR